jgi:hypothetical protein
MQNAWPVGVHSAPLQRDPRHGDSPLLELRGRPIPVAVVQQGRGHRVLGLLDVRERGVRADRVSGVPGHGLCAMRRVQGRYGHARGMHGDTEHGLRTLPAAKMPRGTVREPGVRVRQLHAVWHRAVRVDAVHCRGGRGVQDMQQRVLSRGIRAGTMRREPRPGVRALPHNLVP